MGDGLGSGSRRALIGGLGALARAGRRIGAVAYGAGSGFLAARGPEAAAAMAYYALFSLFPLLLSLIAGASLFLEREQAVQAAVLLVTEALPVSQSLVEDNLRLIVSLRGPAGLVGLAGALWSGSGFFAALSGHLDRAWPGPERLGFLERRFVALSMFATLLGLLWVAWLAAPAIRLLGHLQVPLGGSTALHGTLAWRAAAGALPWVATFGLLVALYRWAPKARIPWTGVLWGAAAATVSWQAAAWGLAWYLGSGLAHYHLVYGGLGAVVALLFWVYLSSSIVLFGAHLGAAAARPAQRGRAPSHPATSDSHPEVQT